MPSDAAVLMAVDVEFWGGNSTTTDFGIASDSVIGHSLSCGCYGWCACHHSWTYVPWYPPRADKVRLSMKEMLHLQRLAKKDKALRETMQKLSDVIEVEVSFTDKE